MIYNISKHKAYIGETSNFHRRATTHNNSLLNNKHQNKDLQNDFNDGCEFSFAILEDMGKDFNREELLCKEKQYIFAFRDKYIKTYNKETDEQLRYGLFYDFVLPSIRNIQSDFYNNFGCYLPTLAICSSNTLKEKFAEKTKK